MLWPKSARNTCYRPTSQSRSPCPAAQHWRCRHGTLGSVSKAACRSWAPRGSCIRSRARPGFTPSIAGWTWPAPSRTPRIIASTGSTSEDAARKLYAVPDTALIDMGDFAGGLLKYLRQHPVPNLVLAGGFAKLVKMAQGALDLHSARSQVDFDWLADHFPDGLKARIQSANTAAEVLGIALENGHTDCRSRRRTRARNGHANLARRPGRRGGVGGGPSGQYHRARWLTY